ncbi:hypothetical protein [Roseivirga thermotolerans]|uniref:Uncharacterized protein n=1 Tax=Roseivirga thermotolerans TaxID=1758176 RepID=A0ABQ3I982_9BACT|nr:hypothetical protein [Roseivirga thermotolerans]GHE66389.1 hypothetical protein GCM10011340_22110 [Roseivirga thermotolerans]
MIHIYLSLVIGLLLVNDPHKINLKNDRQLIVIEKSIRLVANSGETIHILSFNTKVQNYLLIEESLLILNTRNQSHKIEISDSALKVIESRTPDFELPNRKKWVYLHHKQKEFLLEETENDVRIKHKFDSTRYFSMGHFINKSSENKTHSNNMAYDLKNDILIIQISNSDRFFHLSLKEYDSSLSSLNVHLGTKPSYAYWYFDIHTETLACIVEFENKRKNRFEAFLLKDGIPKPQKARDGSKSISQTWYDLGYFIGYLDVLPEEYHKSQFLRENEVLKPKKK